MRIPNKTITAIGLFFAVVLAIFSWTGMDSDLTPYVKRDYATALAQFREAAEQGDAKAQHNLALMYDRGEGVAVDRSEAMKWYLKAAEQGYADSQYNLSVMYYFGEGAPQDYVESYKWATLANNAKEKAYTRDAISALTEKMSPEQIAQAQQAAQDWQEQSSK